MSSPFNRSVAFAALLAVLVACQSTPDATQNGAVVPVTVDRKSAEMFDAALDAIEARDLARGEQMLAELTLREPMLAPPWVNLGLVRSELGDTEGAMAAFHHAIAAEPGNCAAHTELGLMARRVGDFAAAEANYLACVAHQPDFREAHLNLGILYELYLGRLSDALASYRTYLSIEGGDDRKVSGWVMDLERRLALVAESS